jgi:integrase
MSEQHLIEQLRLFDLGLNLTVIREEGRKLAALDCAALTQQAYGWGWNVFTRWCERAGATPFPADAGIVEDFITWAAVVRDDGTPYRPMTIRVFLAAIAKRHKMQGFESPISRRALLLVSNAGRNPASESKRKEAITPELVIKLCKALAGDQVISIRNRSMIALCFAGGFRRSELLQLELRDVSVRGNELAIFLRKSKTDQKFVGRTVIVQATRNRIACPLHQLERWLEVRGDWPGPLFCAARNNALQRRFIGGQALCAAVKEGLRRLGIKSEPYGAHSLRSGFVTAAAENGASELVIRARTGHRQIGALAYYVRDRQGLRINPLKGVL